MQEHKVEHQCERGPTLKLSPGEKCPLCGSRIVKSTVARALLEELRGMDARDDIELSPWEKDFVDSLLRQQPAWLTRKQKTKVLEILARYETS